VYCSAHRALELVSPRLSPALVPEDTLRKVLGFARKHRALGQTQYLECRLGQGRPGQVDLLVSAGTALDGGRWGGLWPATRPSSGRSIAKAYLGFAARPTAAVACDRD
jgi:hypothetical protein